MLRYLALLVMAVMSVFAVNTASAGSGVSFQDGSVSCDGTVTVTYGITGVAPGTIETFLRVDDLGIDVRDETPISEGSGTETISGTATEPLPAPGTQITVEFGYIQDFGSDGSFENGVQTDLTVPNCENDEKISETLACYDDGRINRSCDVAFIYPMEDSEGTHMNVYYVPPNSSGDFGVFGFMVYQDEFEALPDDPEEPIEVASAGDGYITLYKLPSGEYQINAGPINDEGTVRVFEMADWPTNFASEYEIRPALSWLMPALS